MYESCSGTLPLSPSQSRGSIITIFILRFFEYYEQTVPWDRQPLGHPIKSLVGLRSEYLYIYM